MPSGSYRQVDVRCPFYHWDDGSRKISCEGIMDGNLVVLHYRKKADCSTQIRVFCSDRYENCEIYHAAMEKYEED